MTTAGARPDIVLCDVRMRGTSGLDLCRTLHGAEDLVRQLELTLVPGGVDPMTIAMLLRNTATAARLAQQDRVRV